MVLREGGRSRSGRRLCEAELRQRNADGAAREQSYERYYSDGATPGARENSHPPTPSLIV